MIIETLDGQKFEVEPTYIDTKDILLRFKTIDGKYIWINKEYIKYIFKYEEEKVITE